MDKERLRVEGLGVYTQIGEPSVDWDNKRYRTLPLLGKDGMYYYSEGDLAKADQRFVRDNLLSDSKLKELLNVNSLYDGEVKLLREEHLINMPKAPKPIPDPTNTLYIVDETVYIFKPKPKRIT